MIHSIPAAESQTHRTAIVVSTASVNGETISCGCQKKELGGIARRATVIKAERARSEAFLLVDAGDFGSHVPFEPWMRTEFQWKMMAGLGYDVVTPGPNEMVEGIQPLQELYASSPEIQVVSANVTDKQGTLLWPTHAVVERGGVVFGVTGVTDKSYYSFNLTRGKQKANDFAFLDAKESLQGVLPTLKEKADIVVVLFHSGSGDSRRAFDGIEGVDVVVVGHSPTYKFLPERVGETLLIQAGSRGQYLSVLELTLDETNNIIDYNGEARSLGTAIDVDDEFNTVVTAFNKKYDGMKPAEPDKAEEQ
jgi:2',3'-cyclic-nucleotide 2'-phosphodiesterase (5'-nucleotidase family)